MKISGKTALAAALFVVCVFTAGIKMLTPAPLYIFIEGSDAALTKIPGLFTIEDVIIIALSALAAGICALYLLVFDTLSENHENDSRQKESEHVMKTLKGDELEIYGLIFSDGGIIFQSEIVERTGFPKAKVTRCLDALENKKLVERKRKGMGNIVILR